MKKVVINDCHGRFNLSSKAILWFSKKGIQVNLSLIERDDPLLIQCVEELKEEANGRYAFLKIVEIPDDVEWQIDEYDGIEWVAEKHRRWD